MHTLSVDIPVSDDIVERYKQASHDEKEKLEVLMGVLLHDFFDRMTIDEVMDNMSDEAEKNGLTPEVLDAILNSED